MWKSVSFLSSIKVILWLWLVVRQKKMWIFQFLFLGKKNGCIKISFDISWNRRFSCNWVPTSLTNNTIFCLCHPTILGSFQLLISVLSKKYTVPYWNNYERTAWLKKQGSRNVTFTSLVYKKLKSCKQIVFFFRLQHVRCNKHSFVVPL